MSYVGRILMLQSVISAIPAYSMSCLKIPLKVLGILNKD